MGAAAGGLVAGALRQFRVRLGLTVLLASLLPVLLAGALVLQLSQDSLERSAVRRHQDVLDAVTGAARLLLDQRLARLRQLAQAPELVAADPARVSALLHDFLADNTFFHRLDLFTAADAWLAGAQRGARLPADPLLGAPAFGAPPRLRLQVAEAWPHLRPGAPALRLAEEGAAGKGRQLLFLLAVPRLAEPDQLAGVRAAAARLDGPEIQDLLAAFPGRTGEYVCVLDGDGTILARRGPHLPVAARAFTFPAGLREGLARDGAVVTLACDRDDAGEADLVSLSPCPDLGGIVALGQPVGSAFDLVQALRGNLLAILLLAVLLALGASALLAWSLARPIRSLTAGLVAVKDGVYAHRVEVGADDELGAAARALNDLAAMLQRRTVIGSIWEKLRR